MKFVGRANEIKEIEKCVQSDRSHFLAIYGRRRVGKTFLVRQYLKDNLVFDISGRKDGSKKQQISNFFAEYLTRTQGQKETLMPDSWQEAFRYLAQFLSELPETTTKHVVFLDEMPWLDTPKSEFIGALEFFLEPTRFAYGQCVADCLWLGFVLDS